MDPLVEQFERWARDRLAEGFHWRTPRVRLRLSKRTLARRMRQVLGKSPLSYFQDLRVERAAHMLETSDVSVDEIASMVGYADGATLQTLCAVGWDAESVNYASANNMGRRRLMKPAYKNAIRSAYEAGSNCLLKIRQQHLFCDCSSRVDEAAAVERIVPVRPLIVSRLGQPVLQRAHGDVRETLFDQRRDAGSGRSGHCLMRKRML